MIYCPGNAIINFLILSEIQCKLYLRRTVDKGSLHTIMQTTAYLHGVHGCHVTVKPISKLSKESLRTVAQFLTGTELPYKQIQARRSSKNLPTLPNRGRDHQPFHWAMPIVGSTTPST